jgi:hypothetical protein
MGLDTTHDCWHGPYSSFMRWREEVCRAVGWGELRDYLGFGGAKQFPADDPLSVLLAHSDCDGEIAAEECLPLAERLEEIAPTLPDEPKWHRAESAQAKALQFAAGLRRAAAADEPVGFH